MRPTEVLDEQESRRKGTGRADKVQWRESQREAEVVGRYPPRIPGHGGVKGSMSGIVPSPETVHAGDRLVTSYKQQTLKDTIV